MPNDENEFQKHAYNILLKSALKTLEERVTFRNGHINMEGKYVNMSYGVPRERRA